MIPYENISLLGWSLCKMLINTSVEAPQLKKPEKNLELERSRYSSFKNFLLKLIPSRN